MSVYVCVSVCVFMCVYISVCVNEWIRIDKYGYLRVHVRVCVCVRACIVAG